MDKQQIKARFFGAHIGCDVNIFLKGKPIMYATNCGVVTGVRDSVLISVGELAKYSDEEFDIKLVLRHISSLTDREVATMDAIVMTSDKKSAYHNKIEYLRSINVATHFMGLDPIGEGWAILEEKIPENAPQETKKEEEI